MGVENLFTNTSASTTDSPPTGPSKNLEEALQEHEERVDALLKAANKYVGALKTWKKSGRLVQDAARRRAAKQAEELAPELEAVKLDESLQQHGEQVDNLLNAASRYVNALKAWKKACQLGHMANRQKQGQIAVELAPPTLKDAAEEVAQSWCFDVEEYLRGEQWRRELIAVAEKNGLLVIDDLQTEILLSSPVVIRAIPAAKALSIDKQKWTAIRPTTIAKELKRLRDRVLLANSQTFLDSLFLAYKRNSRPNEVFVKLRVIYDQFCETPGWKRDNPPLVFGQNIYALQRSGIRTTRSGDTFEIITPSANARERDIFSVIAEDGHTNRYYGIRFR